MGECGNPGCGACASPQRICTLPPPEASQDLCECGDETLPGEEQCLYCREAEEALPGWARAEIRSLKAKLARAEEQLSQMRAFHAACAAATHSSDDEDEGT